MSGAHPHGGETEGGTSRVAGSFRDPAGFVFTGADGVLYRQVDRSFAAEFDACVAAGLYDQLAGDGLLVPHETAPLALAATAGAHAVLRPEPIPFISYPYEWSFGELKDAALLTLEIQEHALAKGFVLRDASAYNVQFRDGRPLFIDTLSLAPYRDGEPWAAYKQFCEHFLVPLLLMSTRDVRCGLLLRQYIDGIPLDLGSALLPTRTRLSLGALLHVHLHARTQRRYAESALPTSPAAARKLSRRSLTDLAGHLRTAVSRLTWRPEGTEWADYVTDTNYSGAAADAKAALVRRLLAGVQPRMVWDLGANTGAYSRVAREVAPQVVAFDVDPAAVERNYRQVRERGETGLLPLLLDATNPSPAHGWAHRERASLVQRGPADAVLALALVHHLAISNNVPLGDVARFLAELGRTLVIEWVPKEDSQVQRLLRSRPDIFHDYTQAGFERAFATHFTIAERHQVGDSMRSIYLMRAR